MSLPYMKLYIGDYLRDTAHLTTCQHGAYLLWIMHYWAHGNLPKSAASLAKIARLQTKQLPSIWLAVGPFFDADGRHKRIDAELQKARLLKAQRAIAGSMGGRTPRSKR